MIKEEIVTWDQYKAIISKSILDIEGPKMYRGQANSTWSLRTSFHRNTNGFTFEDYFELIHKMADHLGTLENRNIEIETGEGLGSFLAYLQHNGYPTPLLDFSLSPFIAAYFAFSDYNEKSENVSIYMFDYNKWTSHYKQVYDYHALDSHVSVFNPKINGNKKQVSQWGYYYLFTNLENIESHIALTKNEEQLYLRKFVLSQSQKMYALLELESMGITKFSLFGTTESWCQMQKEVFFDRTNNGKGALDQFKKILSFHKESAPGKNK